MPRLDTPTWKVVENVVAAIERSLNMVVGARVISNAAIPEQVSSVHRQVDVYVEIPTGRRTLRVGVEVRDRSSALDLPEIEQLIAKLKKLDVDYGCVVSSSGFTENAKEEAGRNGIELRTIAEVQSPGWWLASAMPLELRRVELVRFQMNFRPEELAHVTTLLVGRSKEVTDVSSFFRINGLRRSDALLPRTSLEDTADAGAVGSEIEAQRARKGFDQRRSKPI